MSKKLLVLFLSVVTFFGVEIASNFVFAEFQVKTNSETGQWLILENGKPVLQYNYKTLPLPDGYFESISQGNRKYAVPRSNYIHPLYDLDGEPITKDWSSDHPHHRGIYWAVPEVGYKNELGDLHALQKIFTQPTDKIETVTENGQLKLVAENVWKWEDKEPIVREQRTITVLPVDKNGRKINLDFQFESLVDEVTLARRQTQHYGGLNTRMLPLKEFKSGSFYGNEKEKETTIPKQELPAWVFGSWKNPKSDGHTELTIFEKATNPDYPGDLIQYPNLNWFQPAFPKKGTRYILKKDKPLILRYQLWLHNAADNDNTKKESWKNFQNEK
ncbi:MAG: PmoA family protein [Planctomycetaceae bacterium]|jgi:hypothetical protein|nr:PmoA family protein [Planctomycetaceae bacterium]